MRTLSCTIVSVIGISLIGGCGGYATPTPDGAANFAAMGVVRSTQTDQDVGDVLKLQPLAQLPTGIAVVRVQSVPWHSEFSVVSMRDVEKPELLDHLGALPMVTGIAPISSIMLPRNPTALNLRQAAAQLHADMLLVYTLESETHMQDTLLPLSAVTLGLSPNEVADASCTASAVLIDTRNGYVYGTVEAHDQKQQLASAWTSEAAQNYARTESEQAAFEKLTAQMGVTWKGVVKELQSAKPGRPSAAP